jgi:hypothetical protein
LHSKSWTHVQNWWSFNFFTGAWNVLKDWNDELSRYSMKQQERKINRRMVTIREDYPGHFLSGLHRVVSFADWNAFEKCNHFDSCSSLSPTFGLFRSTVVRSRPFNLWNSANVDDGEKHT